MKRLNNNIKLNTGNKYQRLIRASVIKNTQGNQNNTLNMRN